MSESQGPPVQQGKKKFVLEATIPQVSQRTYGSGRPDSDDPDEEIRRLQDEGYADVVRDLKLRKAERLKTEEELKIAELKKKKREMGEDEGNGESTVQPTPRAEAEEDTTAADVALLEKMQKAKIPEEEQQAILQKLILLRQAARSKGGAMGEGLVMAMLLNQGNRQSPPAPDMGAYADNLLKALQTGVQLASGGGGESVTDKLLVDAFNKLTATAGQPPAQAKNAIQELGETVKALKDMGLIVTQKDLNEQMAAHSSTAPIIDTHSTDLELERIRGDTNLQIKKIDSDLALNMAKLDIDKKKTDALVGLGERLAGAVGGAMAEGEVAGLEARGATDLSGSTAARASTKDLIEVKCLSCGRPIPVPEPGTARDIKCTSCGAIMGYSPS